MRKIFLFFLVIAALPCFAQDSTMNSSQRTQEKKETHEEGMYSTDSVANREKVYASQKRSQIRREKKREKIDLLISQEEEGVINYSRQTDFGAKLVSDGYGLFMDIGRAKSIKRSVLYQLEIGERKSAREEKQSNTNDPSSSPFIFGKENFFYYTKLGVQEQFLLANKANKNGVNITCNIGGGLSFAILRPYEYEVVAAKGSDTTSEFVQFNSILTDTSVTGLLGGPTISQGWEDLSLTAGVYAKAAVRFDYGHYTRTVTALEIGLSAEYYTKNIPIVYAIKTRQSFISIYAAVIFGWRKKK
jgi:hypothetical protein